MFPMTFVHPQPIEPHRLSLDFARHLHTKEQPTRLWKKFSPQNNSHNVSK
jgi:hypothetical protein